MSEQLIVLLTSRVPPTRDRVGDYTYYLGNALSSRRPVHIVTTQGQRTENGEHGRPIVTTRGHMTDREPFDSAPRILVDAGDEDGFMAACLRLSTEERLQKSLRNGVVRFYERQFSCSLIADKLLNECLNGNP